MAKSTRACFRSDKKTDVQRNRQIVVTSLMNQLNALDPCDYFCNASSQEAEKCENLDNVTIQTLKGPSLGIISVVLVEELSFLDGLPPFLSQCSSTSLPHSAVL